MASALGGTITSLFCAPARSSAISTFARRCPSVATIVIPLRSTSQSTPHRAGRVRSEETAYAVLWTSPPTTSGSIEKAALLSCFGSFGKSSAPRPFITNLLFPHVIVIFSPLHSSPTSSPASDLTISAIFFAGAATLPSEVTDASTLEVTEMSRSVAEMLNTPFSALMRTVDRIGMVVLPGTTLEIAFILWVSSPSGTLTFPPPPPGTGEYRSMIRSLSNRDFP